MIDRISEIVPVGAFMPDGRILWFAKPSLPPVTLSKCQSCRLQLANGRHTTTGKWVTACLTTT